MIILSHTLHRETQGNDQIIDLTDELQALVRQSGVRCGQLTAMVTGSTGALSTLEYEPGLVRHDIAAALERIAPRDGAYEHEETWHDDNGHSHVRACLIGPSLAMGAAFGHMAAGGAARLRHAGPQQAGGDHAHRGVTRLTADKPG
jgi:secondary thiamine-phosphate synthase enzyme